VFLNYFQIKNILKNNTYQQLYSRRAEIINKEEELKIKDATHYS
jgi:hypothetical protein